jgi:acetyl-CoA carboxylase carboxyltransferase component
MPLDAKFRTNLAKRRDKINSSGGPRKIEERHQKGLMTARERLTALFQEDTPWRNRLRHGRP